MRDRSIVNWAGLAIILLIAVTFYVGLTSDFVAFSAGARELIYAVTGRTPNGAGVIAYPR